MSKTLTLLLLAIAFILTACGSKPVNVIESTDTPNYSQQYLDSREYAIEQAEDQIRLAEEQQLPYYSPRRVLLAHEKVKMAQGATTDEEGILIANQVEDLLNKAQLNKTLAEEKLALLLTQRKGLEELHADKVHKARFLTVTQSLKTLIAKMEDKPELDITQDKQRIAKIMTALEVDTLLSTQLSNAEKFFKRATEEDAQSYAPTLYQKASLALKKARTKIRTQPQDRTSISALSEQARHAAQHTLYIAREAQGLGNLNQPDAEQMALRFEQLLHDIAQKMGLKDLRSISLQDQSLAIIQALESNQNRIRQQLEKELRSENQADKQKIEKLEQRLQDANIAPPE